MEQLCPACDMPFDWPGVIADGQEYCCTDCAAGLPCTCPQHDHRTETVDARAGVDSLPPA